MISFYPGPSRIHDKIPQYVTGAVRTGILSANHRSEPFIELSKKTIGLLHEKLRIPKRYMIFFTSSATECWEIIAQSLINEKSWHIYNGAFGQKWFEYTNRLRNAQAVAFGLNEKIDARILEGIDDEEVICVTQNETSNGTQVTNSVLRFIRQSKPNALIAVDATSSLAGIKLNIRSADIWFASVQKCFGLPAGLGLLICSPRAIARAKEINENSHYNSLTFMIEMMKKWQTSFTPNVTAIYLLSRVLEDSPGIADVQQKIEKRYRKWVKFLSERNSLKHLIHMRAVQSYTVVPVAAAPEIIKEIKLKAKDEGMLLGEGYGNWKAGTFRIANFPALKKSEIKKLMSFLEKY